MARFSPYWNIHQHRQCNAHCVHHRCVSVMERRGCGDRARLSLCHGDYLPQIDRYILQPTPPPPHCSSPPIVALYHFTACLGGPEWFPSNSNLLNVNLFKCYGNWWSLEGWSHPDRPLWINDGMGSVLEFFLCRATGFQSPWGPPSHKLQVVQQTVRTAESLLLLTRVSFPFYTLIWTGIANRAARAFIFHHKYFPIMSSYLLLTRFSFFAEQCVEVPCQTSCIDSQVAMLSH